MCPWLGVAEKQQSYEEKRGEACGEEGAQSFFTTPCILFYKPGRRARRKLLGCIGKTRILLLAGRISWQRTLHLLAPIAHPGSSQRASGPNQAGHHDGETSRFDNVTLAQGIYTLQLRCRSSKI